MSFFVRFLRTRLKLWVAHLFCFCIASHALIDFLRSRVHHKLASLSLGKQAVPLL